jgi:hypothetical protein
MDVSDGQQRTGSVTGAAGQAAALTLAASILPPLLSLTFLLVATCIPPTGARFRPWIHVSDSVSGVLQFPTCAAFFWWIVRQYRGAKALGARPKKFSASGAITAFFLPVANLVWPFRALRDLDDAIDPMSLPARPSEGRAMGYRENASEELPPRRVLKDPPLRAWWGLWLARPALALLVVAAGGSAQTFFSSLLLLATASCALAAVLVVRRMDAKLDERARLLGAGQPI